MYMLIEYNLFYTDFLSYGTISATWIERGMMWPMRMTSLRTWSKFCFRSFILCDLSVVCPIAISLHLSFVNHHAFNETLKDFGKTFAFCNWILMQSFEQNFCILMQFFKAFCKHTFIRVLKIQHNSWYRDTR